MVDWRGMTPSRRSIEERPSDVETQRQNGDWEADTIIGMNHQQTIGSLIESKTRFTLTEKVERKTTRAVGQAMIGLLPLSKSGTYRHRGQRTRVRRA